MTATRSVGLAMTLFVAAVATAQDKQAPTTPAGSRPLPEMVAQLQALKAGDAQVKEWTKRLEKMSPEQLQKLMEMFAKTGQLTPPNADGKMPDVPPDAAPPTPPAVPPTTPDPVPTPVPTPQVPDLPMPSSETGASIDGVPAPMDVSSSPADNPDKQVADKVMHFWEKNVGPLDETPGLKNVMLDFLKDGGLSDAGKSGLSELFEKGKLDAGDLPKTDWFDKSSTLGSIKWPELGLKSLDLRMPETGLGNSMPSAPSVGGMDLAGTGSAVTPLLVLVAVAVVAFLAWRFWPALQKLAGKEQTDLRQQPWPFDPRTVADRAALVRAFEFLSVTLCGDAARVWNHRTIATALRSKVVAAGPVADELAALYELARYTPPDEPISDDQLSAARRCLCHLAGVNPA